MHLKSLLTCIVSATVLSLCVGSCGSSRSATKTGGGVGHSVASGHSKTVKPADKDVAKALVREAKEWLGVPYLWGGNDTAGVDCSGFLVAVYRDAAGINLPRTTRLQQQHCLDVDSEERSVGDILFFSSKRSEGKVAHVGMYIGDNKMIHSSSSRGVVIDDLGMRYYQEHYLGVGRPPMLAEAHPIVKKKMSADTPASVGERTLALANDVKKKNTSANTNADKPTKKTNDTDFASNSNFEQRKTIIQSIAETSGEQYGLANKATQVDTTLQFVAVLEDSQSANKSDASTIYEPIVTTKALCTAADGDAGNNRREVTVADFAVNIEQDINTEAISNGTKIRSVTNQGAKDKSVSKANIESTVKKDVTSQPADNTANPAAKENTPSSIVRNAFAGRKSNTTP